MADGVTVDPRGMRELQELAEAYRNGDKALRRRIGKAMRDIANPLARDIRSSAAQHMPRRGGLSERMGRARAGTSLTTSTRNTGVTLRFSTREGYNLRFVDTGRLRHPVFARGDQDRKEWTWVNQQVYSGAFSKAFEAGSPKVRDAVLKAIQQALDEIARDATHGI